jgi:hypothetical protein
MKRSTPTQSSSVTEPQHDGNQSEVKFADAEREYEVALHPLFCSVCRPAANDINQKSVGRKNCQAMCNAHARATIMSGEAPGQAEASFVHVLAMGRLAVAALKDRAQGLLAAFFRRARLGFFVSRRTLDERLC